MIRPKQSITAIRLLECLVEQFPGLIITDEISDIQVDGSELINSISSLINVLSWQDYNKLLEKAGYGK